MKKEENLVSWKCSHCNKEFKYKSEKERHEQSHNPQFECKICSKKFSFLSALRRHEKQHNRKGSVRCEECSRKFRDEILLKRHMQYAHKGTFSCTKCKATFRSETALRIHMKTHKPKSERKYRCSYVDCGKTFNFVHHWKHHELTHTDTKQYFCNECGKGFIQAHHLKSHLKAHNDPDTWPSCPYCDIKYSNEYILKRHIAKHENFKIKLKGRHRQASKQSENQSVTERIYNGELDGTLDQIDYKNFKELNDTKESFSELDEIDIKNVLGLDSCVEDNENSKTDDNSLRAQMTYINENDENPIAIKICDNNNIKLDLNDDLDFNSKQISGRECREKIKKDKKACETCKCARTCGIRENYEEEITNYNTPDVVFQNGVVKIQDTVDIDLNMESHVNDITSANFNDDQLKNGNNEPKLFKLNSGAVSCKDVLGNCIVDGDGTVGEGCLCARMTADDQQMTSQEIEEITPCPKSSWLN